MTTQTQAAVQRPQPLLADSPLYQAHFAALREDRLTVRKCEDCGQLQWPPRDLCSTCQSSRFTVVEVPRTGTVYTYSVMYRAFQPWFADKLPYGVVVVQLTDDVRMMGLYLGDAESLACGQQVEVQIEANGEGIPLVCWKTR